MGHRGWIGLRLDIAVDWDEVAAVAYRYAAPVTLMRQLDARTVNHDEESQTSTRQHDSHVVAA
ncbi:MAG: hypothetical protein ACRDZ4_18640 [Egibacteraceae bacterium]